MSTITVSSIPSEPFRSGGFKLHARDDGVPILVRVDEAAAARLGVSLRQLVAAVAAARAAGDLGCWGRTPPGSPSTACGSWSGHPQRTDRPFTAGQQPAGDA